MILADAGVPMIFLAEPLMVPLLVPVILIELLVAHKVLTSVPFKKKILPVAVANIGSTFLGWPAAWAILFGVQLCCGGDRAFGLGSPMAAVLSVTLQAPWLIPYEEDLYWMVPVAAAFLLLPFFFVSVYSERLVCHWFLRAEPKPSLRRFSWLSNLWSYLFLLVLSALWLAYSLATKK